MKTSREAVGPRLLGQALRTTVGCSAAGRFLGPERRAATGFRVAFTSRSRTRSQPTGSCSLTARAFGVAETPLLLTLRGAVLGASW